MSEYTENTMASETTSEKIKAINPQIIVGGTVVTADRLLTGQIINLQSAPYS